MKKIITVLMVLMVATSMFAETKVSDLFPSDGEIKELFKNEIEERVAYTDTSYKQMDYEKITTDEIISIIDKPSEEMEFEGYELELITYDIMKLDEYAKEYNLYYVEDYKLGWITIFIRIDGETQIVVYYKMKPNK